ncbi:MAG TPA: hypothetical protein VEY94_07685 [Patescibacteria group bacterium]|nr:hypothetical protein [Patescibacteria group bacterium]
MKSSLRGLLICSAGAAALSLMPLAAAQAQSDPGEIDLNAEKIQVSHTPGGTSADNLAIFINFTNNVEGCDGGDDDAIASGVTVQLSPLSCESMFCIAGTPCVVDGPIDLFPFDYDIDPFVAHTVGDVSYGTFFGLNPVGVGPGTVSARIVSVPTDEWVCGTWNLNVHATGLDLSSITSNPISLTLNDSDGSGPFCFDIVDAVIGNNLNPHPTTRRGSRRGRH